MESAIQSEVPSLGDLELIERHRNGDREAFGEIVGRNRKSVYLVARRLLGSHEDADEAAQQAFVRAWRSLGTFRGDAAIRTWLTRIVINVSKTMLAERRAHDRTEDQEHLPDPGEHSDERIARRQLRHRVRQAVSRLPPRQREAVVLKAFSDMTYREVAAVMGLSDGSVKAHFHQAVSNLRRLMQTAGDTGKEP